MNDEQIVAKLNDTSQSQHPTDIVALESDVFHLCAQCGYQVASIKGNSHNYCLNCGFRDSCC